jgi:hypothetical protein
MDWAVYIIYAACALEHTDNKIIRRRIRNFQKG